MIDPSTGDIQDAAATEEEFVVPDEPLILPRNRAVQYEVQTTPIRTRVDLQVGRALISEARRTKRSVAHVTATLLRYWYEDVWIPTQKMQTKKKPPG